MHYTCAHTTNCIQATICRVADDQRDQSKQYLNANCVFCPGLHLPPNWAYDIATCRHREERGMGDASVGEKAVDSIQKTQDPEKAPESLNPAAVAEPRRE